ncbi:MAG: M1 family metallopeptidase [Flavobacteriales bacterium]|nr:M1 family metallopeptidase [Flavobacteriales bacterium]
MRKLSFYYSFIFLFTITFITVNAQRKGYWQQRAEYQMNIDFDVNTHQFKGTQKLVYYNNSGDTLKNVYYHLYFNAFRPNSVMDVRSRALPDSDSRVRDRIQKLKPEEEGWHEILSLKQDNVPVKYHVEGTILEVKTAKPILPGTQVVFDIEFKSQVPVQIRRSGRYNAEGIAYSMSQWYPKMCEFDDEGWHPDPYIGREFYGIWGDFDVKITMDKSFTVAATGVLQNPQECGHGYEDPSKSPVKTQGDKITWHFWAKDVHDFAWGADPTFVHETLQVPDGPLMHFFYKGDQKYSKTWKEFQPYMSRFFVEMSRRFGKYPYPQFSFVQGGDGGMEYPMLTLITGNRSLGSLVGVSVHEAVHNWFYGVLATNEAKHPWMDEGFTTYASEELMDFLFEKNNPNRQLGNYRQYFYLDSIGWREPLCTHSDFYKTNTAFGINAYSAGAIFLNQLHYILGKEVFEAAMLRYFEEWKFKHPNPTDFIRVMEKSSGFVLLWYLEQFVHSTNTIDYGVKEIKEDGKKSVIVLVRNGDFPMPVDVAVELKNGKMLYYTIPLDIMRGAKTIDNSINYTGLPDWPWVNKTYEITLEHKIKEIKRIEIDPTGRLADRRKGDNVLIP